MKKIFQLLIIGVCLFPLTLDAQNAAVMSRLKAKYSLTRYRTECGGWYLLGYSDRGVNYYGFADREGNVIATNAVKYKIHKGFVELQIFDEMKKDEHDQWIADKKQYDRDYQAYLREEQRYENELKAYNARVAAAKKEAYNLWKSAKNAAYNQAVAEHQAKNSNKKSGGFLGAILSGVTEATLGESAASKVAYQPFEDRVMGERGLTVAPYKAYNPMPQMPKEPSNGYEWKSYSLLQPCPYTSIDYSLIEDDKGVTIVKRGDKYGLADASLKEVLSCKYDNIALVGTSFKIEENGLFGLANDKGKIIIPCQFERIDHSEGYLLCKKNKLWGVYTTDFEELYPCQFSNAYFSRVDGKLKLYAQDKSLWGVLDFETGQQLLPYNYGKIEEYTFGNKRCFKVSRDNKIGLHTSSGVLMLPCEYSSITLKKTTSLELIEVVKDGKVGIYDVDGIPVIKAEKYDNVKISENDFVFEVLQNGKKGLCDISGSEVLPCKYNTIEPIKKLKGFLCSVNGKWGIVGMDGKELFPFIQASKMTLSKDDFLVLQMSDWSYGGADFNGNIIPVEAKSKVKFINKVYSYKNKHDLAPAYNAALEKLDNATKIWEQQVASAMNHRNSFSFFAQNYVEKVINDWQKKGEFEKLTDWQKRVNEETRQQKVFSLTKDAQDLYVNVGAKRLPQDKLSIVGVYDPDNETYNIKSNYSKKLLTVHIPVADAENFKSEFNKVKYEPKFTIENNYLGLSEYIFTMPNGNIYRYRNDDALNYSIAKVDYNFDKIELDNGGKSGFSTTALTLGTSDVDQKIPIAQTKQEYTFAVIIANEKYENEKNVEFAYNDGVIFKEYCVKALGLPAENVHFIPNAGRNHMVQQFNWMKRTAEDFNGKASFIIYYAGHGVPDDATKEAYLLPVDADITNLEESAYKLSRLYGILGNMPAKDVLVFMDACFSGAQRNGEVLASARGVAIKPQLEVPKGNMVVFSAVTDKETAFPYKEKVHGLFTYYLLKKIQSSTGTLDLGSLADYVKTEVAQKSIVVNSKPQHPTISSSSNMINSWRNLNIKKD